MDVSFGSPVKQPQNGVEPSKQIGFPKWDALQVGDGNSPFAPSVTCHMRFESELAPQCLTSGLSTFSWGCSNSQQHPSLPEGAALTDRFLNRIMFESCQRSRDVPAGRRQGTTVGNQENHDAKPEGSHTEGLPTIVATGSTG